MRDEENNRRLELHLINMSAKLGSIETQLAYGTRLSEENKEKLEQFNQVRSDLERVKNLAEDVDSRVRKIEVAFNAGRIGLWTISGLAGMVITIVTTFIAFKQGALTMFSDLFLGSGGDNK